jgi:hypothetical protein
MPITRREVLLSPPALSGPLIDKAKWFRISSSDTLSVR